MLRLILILCCAGMLFSCAKEPKHLSPKEFTTQIKLCIDSGKQPIPIYNKRGTIKIYRVDCE